MPNFNYLRGRRFEYAAMKQLEADGFTVYRTAGSHGQYDIIAFGAKVVFLVQCKTKVVDSVATSSSIIKVKEDTNFKHDYPIQAERWTKYIKRKKSKNQPTEG